MRLIVKCQFFMWGGRLYISTTNSLKQNVKYFSWALKTIFLDDEGFVVP